MNESNWETIRRKDRKNIFSIILILLPVLFFAGIFIVNNRDLIIKKNLIHASDTSIAATTTVTAPVESVSVQPPREPVKKKIVPATKTADTVIRPKVAALEKSPAPKKPLPIIPPKVRLPEVIADVPVPVPQKPDPIVGNRSDKLFSELLPPITCYLQSRKDIVIRLSLELFFKDEDTRADIRMHRDDIKVVIMKKVLYNELADMKINTLEAQFYESLNSIFKHTEVVSLKIKDIQLEKAVRQ